MILEITTTGTDKVCKAKFPRIQVEIPSREQTSHDSSFPTASTAGLDYHEEHPEIM